MGKTQIGEISFDIDDSWLVGSFTFRGPAEKAIKPTLAMASVKKEEKSTFRKNLVVQIQEVEGTITAMQYYEKQMEQITKHRIPYERATEPETILISGTEAVKVEQIATSPTGERIRQIQVYAIKNQRAYIFAVANLEGIPFNKDRATLEQILNTININDLQR